jgi:hypothetical protein
MFMCAKLFLSIVVGTGCCILLLIILANKENMSKIPSAYIPYGTISLYNAAPHWGTAFSTDYYLSFW